MSTSTPQIEFRQVWSLDWKTGLKSESGDVSISYWQVERVVGGGYNPGYLELVQVAYLDGTVSPLSWPICRVCGRRGLPPLDACFGCDCSEDKRQLQRPPSRLVDAAELMRGGRWKLVVSSRRMGKHEGCVPSCLVINDVVQHSVNCHGVEYLKPMDTEKLNTRGRAAFQASWFFLTEEERGKRFAALEQLIWTKREFTLSLVIPNQLALERAYDIAANAVITGYEPALQQALKIANDGLDSSDMPKEVRPYWVRLIAKLELEQTRAYLLSQARQERQT